MWHKLKWVNFWRYISELSATIKEDDREQISEILSRENLDGLVDGVEAMHARLVASRSDRDELTEVLKAVAGIRVQENQHSVQIKNCVTMARELLAKGK